MSSSDDRKRSQRIQIRSTTGKIYGPYQRTEIVRLIKDNKLHGDESIFFEGGSRWQALSSDPEFYDLLEAKLLESTKHETVGYLKPSKKKNSSSGEEKTRILKEKKVLQKKKSHETLEENKSLKIEQSSKEEPSPVDSSKKPEKKGLFLFVGALLVLLLFVFFFEGDRKTLSTKEEHFLPRTDLNYASALKEQLRSLKLPSIKIPEDLFTGEDLDFGAGFGAHYWIHETRKSADHKAPKKSLVYWLKLSWNTAWLSEITKIFDESLSKRFYTYSTEIRAELFKKNLLSEPILKFFDVVPLMSEGKWREAHNFLQPYLNLEIARWMIEDSRWMYFWEMDAKESIKGGNNFTFRAPLLKLSSFVRSTLLRRNESLPEEVKNLLQFDTQSWIVWFSLAQYYWRVQGAGVSLAQRYFLTGASVLSLYPQSYQRVFWKQYLKFQKLFGRAVVVKAIENNINRLSADPLSEISRENFYDIGLEGLEHEKLFYQILRRLEQSDLSLIDIASLEVLSRTIQNSEKGIHHVIEFAIFNKRWVWAESLLNEFILRFPDDVHLLGMKMWLNAERFQFEEGLENLDKLSKKNDDKNLYLLYSGILHTIGRSHEKAREDLNNYISKTPNSALAQYFLARSYLEEEKNVDCTKSANLARIHGSGVVQFESKLLYYRCRVLAELGTDEAIKDLGRLLQQSPYSVPLTVEYVQALLNAQKKYEALQAIEKAVVRFPFSYKLKLMMGNVLEKRGKKDEALLLYNEARKLRPDLAETGIAVGNLFEGEERYLEAAQNYEVAARIDPHHPEIYLYAARAYRKAGKKEKAYVMYNREVEMRPAVVDSFIEAAEFMLESNAPRLVPKLFQKYSEAFRGDPRVLIRLAQSYFAIRDYKKAERYAKMAQSQDPKEPEPYRILGSLYESTGQYPLSRRNYERYLILLPQAVDADRIREKLKALPL